jgi:probable F420-dependent oxidoreductase
MDLGRIGIWRLRQAGTEAVEEIEALGFSVLWLGNSPAVPEARPVLEATSTLVVATGIVNIWRYEPMPVAAARAELAREFPGRFLLGIGVGHPETAGDYTKPLSAMRGFFDALDAAYEPVPRDERIAAALGPRMLDLAAERSLGAHPYLATPEHTRYARERMGPGAVLAPEVAVVLETDAEAARATARSYARTYLQRTNYVANLKRLGFTDADLAGDGSDRLIDAVVPHGPPAAIADVVSAHFEAGADHVCVQPLGHGPAPVDDYRALAGVLL